MSIKKRASETWHRSWKIDNLNRLIQAMIIGSSLSVMTLVAPQAATIEKGFHKSSTQLKLSQGEVIDDKVKTKSYIGGVHFGVASPLSFNGDIRSLPVVKKWAPGNAVKVANPRHISEVTSLLTPVNPVIQTRKAINKQQLKNQSSVTDVQVGVNVTGFEFNGVNPPDPTGEVGENYFIHAINGFGGSEVSIFDKNTGAKVGNTFNLSSLASGDCQTGMGDPIIIYDEHARRWMLTEFSDESTKKLCVYISKTNDPIAGGWFAYEFAAPDFPDYPKYSVWGGNYYVSANESGGAVYALERSKMLQGEPATMVRKSLPSLAGFGFQSITPVDADGDNPPVDGTPGLFIRHRDDELHNAGANNGEKDFLELWTFSPDFSNPENSELVGPFNIEIDELDSDFTCPDDFGCLTQKPEDGQTLSTLDPLREVVNFKVQYRNFNSHQSITGSFVTKLEQNNAGLRWFELRKNSGDWSLYQEGMVPATDNNSRYMAGAAQDGDGNMALAYMITGPDQFPSIRMTGRRMADPLGTVANDEVTLFEANGSIATERDGDYAQLSVDPFDNCTFWHTAEFGGAGSQWKTGVSSFKFPDCNGTGSTEPGFSLNATNRNQQVCLAGPLEPIVVTISGFNNFDNNVLLSFADLPAGLSGEFSVNPINTETPSNATIHVANGTDLGDHTFEIQATSEGVDLRSLSGSVKVVASEQTATLVSPENGALKVDYRPELSWTSDGYVKTFTIEIATDENFNNIVASGQVSNGNKYRPSQDLPQSTQYFWRVNAANVCGETISNVFSFTTGTDKDRAEELTPNVAKTIQGDEGEYSDYYIDVPEGTDKLTLSISQGTGDVDLYVGFGKIALTAQDLICRSEEIGNDETCIISDVQVGTYFVTTAAYESFSGAQLIAEFETTNAAPVANNDDFTVIQDSTNNSFDVLQNDSDDEGQLVIDSIEYNGNGQVSIVNDKINYSPQVGFYGNDSLSYTVKDTNNAMSEAFVSIVVERKTVSEPESNSGGGSYGFISLLMLSFLLGLRKSK